MSYLAGYGSLIHPNETQRHAFEVTSRTPVKIFGFKRLFNQRSKNRVGEGEKLSVLNVAKDKSSWLNAILLGGFKKEFHEEIDKREEGYERLIVPNTQIQTYDGKVFDHEVFIYVGLPYMRGEELLPIDSYLDLCIEGAKCYGDEFLEDFLTTTWVRGGMRLDRYLKNRVTL